MDLSTEKVNAELRKMAYSVKGFEKVIAFVWALPDGFWSRVGKRLIATAIVGVQAEGQPESAPGWAPKGVPYDDR